MRFDLDLFKLGIYFEIVGELWFFPWSYINIFILFFSEIFTLTNSPEPQPIPKRSFWDLHLLAFTVVRPSATNLIHAISADLWSGPIIVHTVQVQHLHLAQFGLAGPTLALKVQGACHTLSATSLSEVALRRTCTESIRKKSTLKTALTKKKTKFALSTLGVIYFLIYLPNYRKKMLQRRPRQPLLPHPIMMLRSLRMMSWHMSD